MRIKNILISKYEYDVANFRVNAKHMDNLQIADLIKNVFKPDKSYSFPISKTNGKSFLYKWFDNYSWLCYSPSLDGAFCLPCVLFGYRFPTKTSTIKKLFSEPITHWNDASAAFKRHVGLGTKTGSKSGLHESTSALFTSFISQMSGKTQPIEVMVNEHAQKYFLSTGKSLFPLLIQLSFVAVLVCRCEDTVTILNIIPRLVLIPKEVWVIL